MEITLDDRENLQRDESFKPKRAKPNDLNEIHEKMEAEIINAIKDFCKYRFYFVSHLLNTVLNEKKEVDAKIASLQNTIKRICSNESCARSYNNLKRKCDTCRSAVVKDVTTEPVFRDEQLTKQLENLDIGQNKSLEKRPNICMAESILLNPNSYKNVEKILREIKKFTINDDRKWVFSGCDGPLRFIRKNY